LVTERGIGLHQGTIGRLGHLPQGDPTLTPFQDLAPPLFRKKTFHKSLDLPFETRPQTLPFEDHPLIVEPRKELPSIGGYVRKQPFEAFLSQARPPHLRGIHPDIGSGMEGQADIVGGQELGSFS